MPTSKPVIKNTPIQPYEAKMWKIKITTPQTFWPQNVGIGVFLPREAAMLEQSWDRDSVRPFDTHVLCDKIKEHTAKCQHFDTIWKGNLITLWTQNW